MDESNLPRLDLRSKKKPPHATKQDTLPQLYLKQRQTAPHRDIPRSSPTPAASAPGYQEQERYQPSAGYSRLGKRLFKDTQTGEYRETRDYVDVPQASRRQGLYVIGATGTGKSGLIENLIVQDIKQGYGVCVLDPHGDLIKAVLERMDRREDDVIFLDIKDYHNPFGINLFACSDPTNPLKVQEIVEQVTHIFEKLLGVSTSTPLILEYLMKCTQTLIANPGYTMAEIPLLLQDEQCRKRLVANVSDIDVTMFWKRFEGKRPIDREEEAAGVLRRVSEFLQPLTRNIVGQSTSTIDLQRIMDEGKILLVKLSAQYQSISNLIGSTLIALTLNAMYARPASKRRQFNLYADEFQRFATEDFATLLTEARKFGIATTIAHQARFQPGMTDGIRATTLGAANLVVFRVQPEDATELAGRFDITPQEAWEEEIEKESLEVLKPQKHQRVEEQITDYVEEDIQEISQNPVDFLVGARGSHGSARVRELTQAFLAPFAQHAHLDLAPVARGLDSKLMTTSAKTLLNALLSDVMEGRLGLGTEEFVRRIDLIAQRARDTRETYPTYEEISHISMREEFLKKVYDCIMTLIWAVVSGDYNLEEVKQNLIDARIDLAFYQRYSIHIYEANENLYSRASLYGSRKRVIEDDKNYLKEKVLQQIDRFVSFIENLVALCEGLAVDPIYVPTGQKRMVPRIHTQVNWLTDESEKITHPRKTIMHPQRTYADVLNEVASQIANLPVYTAKVKITVDKQEVEHTIKTLDPKQEPGKPLFGQALQDRIARIQAHNRTSSIPGALPYCRSRQEVEAEIRQRQERCSEPPPEEPPISRRPPR